jgi:uncharacterized peroxidase-related enzyme
MSRIKPIPVQEAQGELKQLYASLEKNMGKVLNIFQSMGNSPATLKAFLGLNEAASHSRLSPQLREQISLAVGEANRCQYCLSAHTAVAKKEGIPESAIAQARRAQSSNPKENAILHFTKIVVEKRGQVTENEVAALKKAGVSDQEIVEIILLISINIFTNYFNIITDTAIDFPVVSLLEEK